MKRRMKIFTRSALAMFAVCGLLASGAVASPVWKFNGTELTGTEKIVGAATESYLTIPGLKTTCTHFLYGVNISKSGGVGKGSITEVPLYECFTNFPVCTVESVTPEKLPWAAKLMTVAGKNYIFIEGIKVSIVYGGAECALGGTKVVVEGTAGGLLDNATETATFNGASFTATGAKLKVGSTAIEWFGVFPTEGFEWHREQAISVS
jgi:hypothetical protein